MKTFVADIIPSLSRYSKKLDILTKLTTKHWVVLDEFETSNAVYIFSTNNDLIISQNGKAEIAEWKYLAHNKILIKRNNQPYIFEHGFLDNDVLALKVHKKNEYLFLINEHKYSVNKYNTINKAIMLLNSKYSKWSTDKLTSAIPTYAPITLEQKMLIEQSLFFEKWDTITGIFRTLFVVVILGLIIWLVIKVNIFLHSF